MFLPEGFASAANTVVRNIKYEPWTLYGGNPITKLCHRKHDNILEISEKILLKNNNVVNKPDKSSSPDIED